MTYTKPVKRTKAQRRERIRNLAMWGYSVCKIEYATGYALWDIIPIVKEEQAKIRERVDA